LANPEAFGSTRVQMPDRIAILQMGRATQRRSRVARRVACEAGHQSFPLRLTASCGGRSAAIIKSLQIMQPTAERSEVMALNDSLERHCLIMQNMLNPQRQFSEAKKERILPDSRLIT
jgi:hypothetical protein